MRNNDFSKIGTTFPIFGKKNRLQKMLFYVASFFFLPKLTAKIHELQFKNPSFLIFIVFSILFFS